MSAVASGQCRAASDCSRMKRIGQRQHAERHGRGRVPLAIQMPTSGPVRNSARKPQAALHPAQHQNQRIDAPQGRFCARACDATAWRLAAHRRRLPRIGRAHRQLRSALARARRRPSSFLPSRGGSARPACRVASLDRQHLDRRLLQHAGLLALAAAGAVLGMHDRLEDGVLCRCARCASVSSVIALSMAGQTR